MTTQTPKIGLLRLRHLINEETSQVTEAVDHASAAAIVGGASNLLKAIEKFKEKASPAAVNALTPHLGNIEKVLEDMVNTPGSYVARVKVEPKKVSLKAVKKEGALKEATGGDGKLEKVTEQNWQHLEVGNTYLVKAGRDRTQSNFVGWVDKNGEHTDNEDPTQVDLKFVDVKDGFEWTAYHHDGGYAVGSSADALYVKETDQYDGLGEVVP